MEVWSSHESPKKRTTLPTTWSGYLIAAGGHLDYGPWRSLSLSEVLPMSVRLLVFLLLLVSVPCSQAAEPIVVDVWPEGKIPGEPSGIGAEKEEPQRPDQKQVKRI